MYQHSNVWPTGQRHLAGNATGLVHIYYTMCASTNPDHTSTPPLLLQLLFSLCCNYYSPSAATSLPLHFISGWKINNLTCSVCLGCCRQSSPAQERRSLCCPPACHQAGQWAACGAREETQQVDSLFGSYLGYWVIQWHSLGKQWGQPLKQFNECPQPGVIEKLENVHRTA